MSEKSSKAIAISLALGCAGTAVVAPYLAPFLAVGAGALFGELVKSSFATDQGLGKLALSAIAGFATEFGGVAFEKLPHALSSEQNHDLEKALGNAFLRALKDLPTEIDKVEHEAQRKDYQDEASRCLSPINHRIERGLKNLGTLFPFAEIARNSEQFILALAEKENVLELLAADISATLTRWLREEDQHRGYKESKGYLAESFLNFATPILAVQIGRELNGLVKQDDFKKSWIAFQRAHLQGSLEILRRLDRQQQNLTDTINTLAKRIDNITQSDTAMQRIGDGMAEMLTHLDQKEDERQQFLTDLIDKLTADLKSHVTDEADRVIKKVDERFDDLDQKLRPRPVVPQQIPSAPDDFTGRDDELTELRELVKSGGVTITGLHGMGGVGKTALALKLAAELRGNYPDGQIYRDLKGVHQRNDSGLRQQPLSPVEVMSHVIRAFSADPQLKLPDTLAELRGIYHSVLADRRVLLLFDNAREPQQLTPLIPNHHQCLMLVTSRQRFALGGRQPYDIDKLKPEDAVSLLRKNSPSLSQQDALDIAEICDYLPMALKPAVSLLSKSRLMTPERLKEKLRDKKQLLKLNDTDRADELLNLSIEASFALSDELLAEDDIGDLQLRWHTLAVFPDTFDEAAAAAVLAMEEDAARSALDALDSYSLIEITSEPDTHESRFSLHDLARDYCHSRLSDDERDQSQFRHADYFNRLLRQADDLYESGHDGITASLKLFDREWNNIHAGQAWSAERAVADNDAAQLCLEYPGGVYLINLRLHPRDWIRWLEAALNAARQLQDRPNEGVHLGNLGIAWKDLGEVRKAIEYYEQALIISREIGDRHGEGTHLGNLGGAWRNLGDKAKACALMKEAVQMLEQIESPKAAIARQLLEEWGCASVPAPAATDEEQAG